VAATGAHSSSAVCSPEGETGENWFYAVVSGLPLKETMGGKEWNFL
jgi:hypothetical protein